MINRNCHFCRHLRCSYVRKTCLKYVCYALGIFPELFRFDIFFCAEFFNNICFWSSTYFSHFYSRKVSREIFKTLNLRYTIGNSEIRMAAWKFKFNLLCKVFSIPIVLSFWCVINCSVLILIAFPFWIAEFSVEIATQNYSNIIIFPVHMMIW